MISPVATLISMSIMGSIAAGFVILIRTVFGRKISATGMLFIWIPVILRFLIPYIPSTQMSVYNYVPADINIYSPARLENLISSSAPSESKADIALIIWVCGMIICAGVYIYSYFRFRNSLIESEWDTQLLIEKTDNLKKARKIKDKIKILVCKNNVSPMIIGFIRPVLIIPQTILEKFDSRQIEFVIIHELTHVKRKDRFLNLILMITCCIHWFNPFVRLISSIVKKDNENACDESVIRFISYDEKYLYSKTLIDLAEIFCMKKNAFYTLAMANGKKSIKNRICRIYSAGKKRLNIIALPVCVITCTILMTGAVSGDVTDTAQKIAKQIQNIPEISYVTGKPDSGNINTEPQNSNNDESGEGKSEPEDSNPVDASNEYYDSATEKIQPESIPVEQDTSPAHFGQQGQNHTDNDSKPSTPQSPPQNYESAEKTYTYQNVNTVAALSNDPYKSGFAHNSENLKIETVAVLSATDEKFRGYFNIYRDGVLTAENVRATVSASPSSITFNDEQSSENDYSFNVQTKTIG